MTKMTVWEDKQEDSYKEMIKVRQKPRSYQIKRLPRDSE